LSDLDFLEITPRLFDNTPSVEPWGWIRVSSGVVGGKTREVVPTIVSAGKNAGKASATTPFCQALRDALGLYNKYAQKHVPATADGSTLALYPPMLAKKIDDVRVALSAKNPGFVQRKYNGVRTMSAYDLSSSRAVMYSRTCIEYLGFSKIREEVGPVLREAWAAGKKIYLDGEVYEHGASLQQISGDARRIHGESETAGAAKYMIYDCWLPEEPTLTFQERYAVLSKVVAGLPGVFTAVVPTTVTTSMDAVLSEYESYLREGYEGAILRLNKPYVVSENQRRSPALLKIKPTHDAEFELVGFSTGKKGKSSKSLMVTCAADIGGVRHTFNVTPAMEIKVREALFEKWESLEANGRTHFANEWLGARVTVYFAETSEAGIPQQARTKLERRVD
jgi:ATP-dependent DNA ligase